ncbi:hypothetical protein [Streptomyces sp. NPDC050704]|uniref:hypothetical protein n=1 Tax=Streptomyces sp. NPDC050704 TaxID=3157219 RepID=UPI00341C2EA0
MAVFAVIIPVLMLGVVVALGRYEEWLLPPASQPADLPLVPEPDETGSAALSH